MTTTIEEGSGEKRLLRLIEATRAYLRGELTREQFEEIERSNRVHYRKAARASAW